MDSPAPTAIGAPDWPWYCRRRWIFATHLQIAVLCLATATILDVASVNGRDLEHLRLDGDSLLPLMRGDTSEWKDEAFTEHLAHGTDRARAMVRQGNWKFCYSHGNPPDVELYDLSNDPGEFNNLANIPEHREIQERLLARVMEHWGDPDELTEDIALGQESRLMIREVLGEQAIF